MANDQDLAGLPADVQKALHDADAWCDNETCETFLRLARENADLASQVEGWKLEASRRSTYRDRAERAEAELAALKRRIAEAATGIAKRSLAPGCLVIEGFDDDPSDFHNERVALLPVGGDW